MTQKREKKRWCEVCGEYHSTDALFTPSQEALDLLQGDYDEAMTEQAYWEDVRNLVASEVKQRIDELFALILLSQGYVNN